MIEPEPEVAALEARAKAIRLAQSVSLYADAFDRWGPQGDSPARRAVEAEAAQAQRDGQAATAWIRARVSELRAAASELPSRWAEIHVELLDEYLGRVAADSTEASVARKEREHWQELGAGRRDWVDQNCFYVHYDDALYRARFGFDYR